MSTRSGKSTEPDASPGSTIDPPWTPGAETREHRRLGLGPSVMRSGYSSGRTSVSSSRGATQPTGRGLHRSKSYNGSYSESGRGKRLLTERFINDVENNELESRKKAAAKKKKALADLRSNGVKDKCNNLLIYSQKSGFKVSATFLPTWMGGKKHVILSKNWEEDDRPLMPSTAKEYVKGDSDTTTFPYLQREEPVQNQGRRKRHTIIGSQDGERPPASQAVRGKRSTKVPMKCTICNASYREKTKELWMFCGSSVGKQRCKKLAIHASCHFVVGKSQKEVDTMCKKFIRCYDCRLIEEEKPRGRAGPGSSADEFQNSA